MNQDEARAAAMLIAFKEILDYVMARIRNLESIGIQPPDSPDDIDWKASKWGEWAFRTTREGTEIPSTHDLTEAIRGAGGKLVKDGFEYSISKNSKFLQKRRVKA